MLTSLGQVLLISMDISPESRLLTEVDTAVHHMEHLSADRQLNVVVLPKGLFEQRVTVGLHHTIYIQGEEGRKKSNHL